MRCLTPGLAYFFLGLLAWKACGQSPDERRINFSDNVENRGEDSVYQPREHSVKSVDPNTYSALMARGSNPNIEKRWVNFDNETYPVNFSKNLEKKTLRQVNEGAPVYYIPLEHGTVPAKPQVRQVVNTPDGNILVSGFDGLQSQAPAPAPGRALRKQGFPMEDSPHPRLVHITQSPDGTFFVDGKQMPSAPLPSPAGGKDVEAFAETPSWQSNRLVHGDESVRFSAALAPTHSTEKGLKKAVWPLGAVEDRGQDFEVHSLSTDSKKAKVHSKSISSTIDSLLNNPGVKTGFSGDLLALIAGVRVSIPWVGWGFNFCIDKFFGSWPKVGIVIPNPVAWLLPEFVEMGNDIQTVLRIPSPGSGAPLGARISPTSDGFLIWLPSIQPRQISEFGFRYGVQIAQLFGVDFGFGWSNVRCGVDFVRV
eukprot:jgi/Botrbrau1/2253/Bobra.101_2s0077.1